LNAFCVPCRFVFASSNTIATSACWYEIVYVIASAGVLLNEVVSGKWVVFGCFIATPVAWWVAGEYG
jgi:hypothetical protein